MKNKYRIRLIGKVPYYLMPNSIIGGLAFHGIVFTSVGIFTYERTEIKVF